MHEWAKKSIRSSSRRYEDVRCESTASRILNYFGLLHFISWVPNPRPARLYYTVRGHICKLYIVIYTIRITQWFRRLGIPIIIFPSAAREPSHNNGVWPFATKCLDTHILCAYKLLYIDEWAVFLNTVTGRPWVHTPARAFQRWRNLVWIIGYLSNLCKH